MAATHEQDGPIDPWKPEALRVSPDDVPTERVLAVVPARPPKREEFFRVHSAEDYTLDVLIYVREHEMDKERYLIAPSLQAALPDIGRIHRLFTCLSRRGVCFLWPAPLPAASGSGRSWHASALEAAEEAKKTWLRLESDKDAGGYNRVRAKVDFGEPAWPDMPFGELLKIAFRDRLIDTPYHDVIRELNGEL
jgi:hypothetical protein